MRLQLLGHGAFGDAGGEPVIPAAPGTLNQEIDGFLLRSPKPGSTEVAEFLKLYTAGAPRELAARALIARGVDARAISNALTFLNAAGRFKMSTFWGVASLVSGAASAFHGYRRNQSIGWGAWWFVMGTIFPVITPAIGAAQGFGKRKGA